MVESVLEPEEKEKEEVRAQLERKLTDFDEFHKVNGARTRWLLC